MKYLLGILPVAAAALAIGGTAEDASAAGASLAYVPQVEATGPAMADRSTRAIVGLPSGPASLAANPPNGTGLAQDGPFNAAGVTQTGAYNIAVVHQAGAYNSVVVEQTGIGQSAAVLQLGSGNTAIVSQR